LTSRDFRDHLPTCGLLGLSAIAVFGAHVLFDRLGLDPIPLGSANFPTRGYAYFLAVWTFLGGIAAVALALALARFSETATYRSLTERVKQFEREATWIVAFSLVAFAVPVLVRVFVLQFTPLTDDESIYRFTVDLLTSGRIAAPRPPDHLFWDRPFMIIDDHMYGHYFLGWPAVLAAFRIIGLEELAACFCAAATIPPVYLSSRRIGGSRAARVTAALFVLSPMLMIGSATLMSHAACMCANAWALFFFLRAREPESAAWESGVFALLVSVAFFIRPVTTVALCGGLVVLWLAQLRRAQAKLPKLLLFGAIVGAMGALFLLVNYALTGDPFYVPYQRAVDYVVENHYRFGYFLRGDELAVAGLRFDPSASFAMWLGSLFRFNYAVEGWPIGFLFLPFARGRRVAVLWIVLVVHIGLHFFTADGGIDTFGPTRYYELSLPFLMLTGNGATQLQAWASARRNAFAPREWTAALPLATVAALLITATLGFTAMRLTTVHRLANSVRRPLLAVEEAGIHDAIVFRRGNHATLCDSAPAQHFVFWPPRNDPDLQADVLWANHLSVEWDRALMEEHFPGRKGYIYFWKSSCDLALLDLDRVRPGTIPDAPELSFKSPLAGPDD
jgi:hypothetical protein